MNDLAGFWETPTDREREDGIEPPPTAEIIASVEAELGCRLPESYVELMRIQNGGSPVRRDSPAPEPTSWSKDHVAIHQIKGIGRKTTNSLCGSMGSRFWIEEWEYPAIGIYFADCPSAGHDMLALDYRACGPEGEPSVVHVDQERDFRITTLAPDFATFVANLKPEGFYEYGDEDE